MCISACGVCNKSHCVSQVFVMLFIIGLISHSLYETASPFLSNVGIKSSTLAINIASATFNSISGFFYEFLLKEKSLYRVRNYLLQFC